MQPPPPSGQLGLDLRRPNDGAAVGQFHIFLEIPAQVLVVGVAQEGGKGLFDADALSFAVGQRDGEAVLLGRGEEQTNFLQGAGCLHALLQSRREDAGR
ncbi:MAG: hypothetical protein IPK02_19230 [Candidatus Accumulibacter sp.]|uniref:Uncharacterized protein n=1 Tax=Candidatus Accumulibacter affinis TaxID=2954384 RepID=A0A935TKC2_9PROT|nr:hypothetical protein [Candidatus Accumulibacter affinis]